MRNLARFILIGSFFATVEEFLTVVVLRGDVASYVFTLLLLFPGWLTVVFIAGKALDRMFRCEAAAELAHFIAFGWLGLMIEWFVIGLSPWSNPAANPLLMTGFQIGMFAFWSTVSAAPRLLQGSNPGRYKLRRRVLWFYIPYFAAVYIVSLLAPTRLRFGIVIPAVIVGYVIVNLLFVNYFLRRYSEPGAVHDLQHGNSVHDPCRAVGVELGNTR